MVREEWGLLELNEAYVENAVDAAELLHAKQEGCQTSPRAHIPGEDVKEAVFFWSARVRGNTLLATGVGGVDEVVSFNAGGCQFNFSFLTLCMADSQDVPSGSCLRLTTAKG